MKSTTQVSDLESFYLLSYFIVTRYGASSSSSPVLLMFAVNYKKIIYTFNE